MLLLMELFAEERSVQQVAYSQITIRAFLQGNQTVISVADDGAGIDPETVKRRRFKGLITPEMVKHLLRRCVQPTVSSWL